MNHKPYFPFFAADFVTSKAVADMSSAEIGTYILMLSYCWMNGNRLANDDRLLGKWCKDARQLRIKRVKNEFKTTSDDKYIYHPKLEEIMRIQREKTEKLSNAGKRGNEKRWGNESPPDRNNTIHKDTILNTTISKTLEMAIKNNLEKLFPANPAQAIAVWNTCSENGRLQLLQQELSTLHMQTQIKNPPGYIYSKYVLKK